MLRFFKPPFYIILTVFVLLGLSWIFLTLAAAPTLDTFPLATNKYQIHKNWPPTEARSYTLNYNVHHDYNASDIFMLSGTTVRAAKSGKVTSSKDGNCSGGTGASVTIAGSDGYTYMYLHMQNGSRAVGAGATVSAGQALGRIGESGCAAFTSPHLHFEVRKGGTRINIQPSVTESFNRHLSSWQAVSGRARDIGAGAIGVYITGTDNYLYRWSGTSWVKANNIVFNGTRLDVGNDVWVRDANGYIYQVSAGTGNFQYMKGQGKDIGVGADGSVWVAGTNGYGYKWNKDNINPSWSRVNGGALSKLDVDGSGRPWKAVDRTGNVYQYTASGNDPWAYKNGAAWDIGIGNDQVWVIGRKGVGGGFNIFRYLGSGNWKEYDGGAVHITVDPNGRPWIVNSNGNIYHFWISDADPKAGSIPNPGVPGTPNVPGGPDINIP